MVRGVADILAFAGAAWLAVAVPPRAPATAGPETGTVASVIDGETLQLTDGRTVRLIGAKAPMPPLGWRGDDPWPFVDDAREMRLPRSPPTNRSSLQLGGSRLDRHGHLLAQVFVVSGDRRLWLQEALIAKGLARVYSFPDNRACVGELLAREAEARDKRLGFGAPRCYRVADALDLKRLGRLTHSYQLVEGTVISVGEGGGRIYLNFAKDWRSDFTISIDRKAAPDFAAAGIDLKASRRKAPASCAASSPGATAP